MGHVQGIVEHDLHITRFWGWLVLRPLLAVSLLGLLVLLVMNITDIAMVLTLEFLPLLVVGLIVLLVLRVSLGAALLGTARLGASAAVGGAKLAAGAVGGTMRAGGGGLSEEVVPLHRFRVLSIDGSVQACVMAGHLPGTEVRAGDLARVHGRRHRDGYVRARRVEILQHPNDPQPVIVRPVTPVSFYLKLVGDVVAYVIALALIASWVGFLIGGAL